MRIEIQWNSLFPLSMPYVTTLQYREIFWQNGSLLYGSDTAKQEFFMRLQLRLQSLHKHDFISNQLLFYCWLTQQHFNFSVFFSFNYVEKVSSDTRVIPLIAKTDPLLTLVICNFLALACMQLGGSAIAPPLYECRPKSSYRLTKKELCHSNETCHALTFPNTNCIISFQINPHWINNSGLWKVSPGKWFFFFMLGNRK